MTTGKKPKKISPVKHATLPAPGADAVRPIVLKKAVETINKKILGTLSFGAKKLSNALTYIAYDDLESSETHYVSVVNLKKLLNFDSNDDETLREYARELVKVQIEFSYFDHKNKDKWGISVLFSEIFIEKGVVRFSIPSRLRALIYNPEIYAKIDLQYQRQFKSAYTLHLYEMCTRYKDIGTSGFWSIEQLKTVFNLDPQKQKLYEDYRYFNTKILKPSIEEVNKVTDIHISMERHIQNRSVVGVTFAIKKIKKAESVKQESTNPIIPSGKTETVKLRLKALGFKPNEIEALATGYETDYLAENIGIVEKAVASGNVKSPTGYLIKALKTDFRPIKKEAETKKLQTHQTELFSEPENKAKDVAEKIRYEEDNIRIKQAYDQLSLDEQKKIYTDFLASNPPAAKLLRSNPKSTVIDNFFSGYLSGTWWPGFSTIKRK